MTSQFATSNQQLNLPLSVFCVLFASRYRLSVAYGSKVAKTLFNPFFHRQPSLQHKRVILIPTQSAEDSHTHLNEFPYTIFLLNNPPAPPITITCIHPSHLKDSYYSPLHLSDLS